MNLQKVDAMLVKSAWSAEDDKKLNCLVSGRNFKLLKTAIEKLNIQILDEYLFINCFYVAANKKQISLLSKLAEVKYICANISALALMHVARKVLRLPQNSLTGRGVGVAIIDTGVSAHYDFCLGQMRIKQFVDFVGNGETMYDDNGHGSFVCGVCAGNGAASGGKFKGIAPNAEIYALKALDKNGEAYSNNILSAMGWVYDNCKRCGIKVVCMSFGSEPLGFNDPIMLGAEELWKRGVIVVAAAGNSGPQFQSIKSPGVSRRLITVGGMDDNRIGDEFVPSLFEVASFSSRGPSFRSYKPDVVAPAVEVCSCDNRGGYMKLSGTSVATPMIAGAMCLICEKHPSISPDEAKRKLIACCNPICFNKNLEGYGYPNLTKFFD